MPFTGGILCLLSGFRPMDPKEIRLVGLHRAEFERAKADQKRAFWTKVCITLLACVSVLWAKVTYLAMVLSLIVVSVWWFFSWRSKLRRGTAERARRALCLMKGLGWQMSPREVTDLLASFSASESEGRKWEDGSYFDSVGDPNPGALAEIIAENAFWTKHLFLLSMKRYWLYFALIIAFFVIILLAIIGLPGQECSTVIAQLVCLFLMSFIAINIFGKAIAFFEAYREMSSIDDRLAAIISAGSSEPDVICAFGDYNAAVQEAPLIPTIIYEKNKERLNRLWKERRRPLKS